MGLVRLERGQLVLAAAAVVAIAMVPVLLAYLQLGYHPDVETEPEFTGAEAIEYLDRSVHNASAAHAGTYGWDERDAMADAVRGDLEGDVEQFETARVAAGVAYDVEYNASAADAWATDNCERGAGRRFGDCAVDGGLVVQERADEAVLLAVAFDVHGVGERGSAELTTTVEVGGAD